MAATGTKKGGGYEEGVSKVNPDLTHPLWANYLLYYLLDDRLDLGRKAMPGWLDFVVAELLDEVGADEQRGGEEDLDDDEYCDYHCSGFFRC